MLVIALTGLYTILGGMRAVAYNDAVQAVVLICGSGLLTGLRALSSWAAGPNCGSLCGSDMFNLWKPLIPPGVEATWAPVLEKNAAGQVVKEAWYFNSNFPWLGMAICAPSSGCGIGVPTSTSCSGPSALPIKGPPAAAASSPPSSSSSQFTCSSSRA